MTGHPRFICVHLPTSGQTPDPLCACRADFLAPCFFTELGGRLGGAPELKKEMKTNVQVLNPQHIPGNFMILFRKVGLIDSTIQRGKLRLGEIHNS